MKDKIPSIAVIIKGKTSVVIQSVLNIHSKMDNSRYKQHKKSALLLTVALFNLPITVS